MTHRKIYLQAKESVEAIKNRFESGRQPAYADDSTSLLNMVCEALQDPAISALLVGRLDAMLEAKRQLAIEEAKAALASL